jgi:TRAP-type C4-dicarboxylate transport system permease small subunit
MMTRIGRWIERLALILALGGGSMLVAITLVAIASIVGRSLPFPTALPGDVEIAQLGTAIAVLAFLPYAHLRRANVIVDMVTKRLAGRTRAILDLTADALFLAVSLLLVRQAALGFLDKLENGGESMVLRIPEWATHGFGVLALGVLVLAIGLSVARVLVRSD